MNELWVKIILAVIAIFVGIKFITKIVINSKKNITKVKQNKNVVFGDQAGRDINKEKNSNDEPKNPTK